MVPDERPVPAERPAERNETPAERLDRNWGELLQELRVTQTGIQILTGFLLILPFQARFTELAPVLIGVFLAAVAFSALATALVLTPVTAHRILFRRHEKDVLVNIGGVMAMAGLSCLAITVGLVATLVVGMIAGVGAGILAGVCALLVFALLWLVTPLMLVRRRHGAHPYE